MSDQPPKTAKDKPVNLGVYGKSDNGLMAADIIAITLSGVWLLGALIFYVFISLDEGSGGQFSGLAATIAVILPVALIWIGSTMVKTTRIMRDEASRLQASIDAMRHAYITQNQTTSSGMRPDMERKIDAIAASQRQTEAAIASFIGSRTARTPQAPPLALADDSDGPVEDQPALALGNAPVIVASALSVPDFIGALNFPENEDDKEGFRQLRLALADPNGGRLVRSAQDILTLLSQDGIYMDDLKPDPCNPTLWRKFAKGERGPMVSAIGGIHDQSSIALTTGRMRKDPIFRDTVHHFLRQFDTTFTAFAKSATDEDIALLSDTRSARGFMLLGRVTGMFE